jgi:hypothetical protein
MVTLNSDRRLKPRFLYFNEAVLDGPGHISTNLQFINISSSGVRFSTDQKLENQRIYKIRFNVLQSAHVSGTIRILDSQNIRDNTFLIRAAFAQISENQKEIIDQLITSFQKKGNKLGRRPDEKKDTTSYQEQNEHEAKNIHEEGHHKFQEQASLELHQTVKAFADLSSTGIRSKDLLFNRVIALVHEMCFWISACEKSGKSKEEIIEIVNQARLIHSKSNFIKRLQDWPRGYPGDFETIDYLIAQKNLASPGTVEYQLENYALSSSIAQQHRNKIVAQARMILEKISANNSAVPKSQTKILILACGSSPDLRSIKSELLRSQNFKLVLNDIDPDAIRNSAQHLKELENYCHYVVGNVFLTWDQIRKEGPYDLILAGGLFDYLTEKQGRILIKRGLQNLTPLGKLFFTNIAKGNPYKHWIEYLADWYLIERDEEQIINLINACQIADLDIKLNRDSTNLTIFTELQTRLK